MKRITTRTTAPSSRRVPVPMVAVNGAAVGNEEADIPDNSTDRELLTHLQFGWHRQGGSEAHGSGPASDASPREPQAMKYLAFGWWQMMAVVDCSGWSWNPSLTSTPIRSAPSSSTTLALSSNAGQAG